jgi:hypothetical protein
MDCRMHIKKLKNTIINKNPEKVKFLLDPQFSNQKILCLLLKNLLLPIKELLI